MEKQDWTAEINDEQKFCLPEPMKSRYTGYPESWVRFDSIVKSMVQSRNLKNVRQLLEEQFHFRMPQDMKAFYLKQNGRKWTSSFPCVISLFVPGVSGKDGDYRLGTD